MSPRPTKRVFRDVVISGRPVEFGRGPGGGFLEGGLELMREVTFDVIDPELGFSLVVTLAAVDLRLACTGLTVQRLDDGPVVTGKALREIPVQSYLDLVRRQLLASSALGNPVLLQRVSEDESAVAFEPPAAELARMVEAHHRRRSPPSQTLPIVAEVYMDALRDPDPEVSRAPTKAVAQRMSFSRGHAARLVTEARRSGLIGPARRGRAVRLSELQEEERP